MVQENKRKSPHREVIVRGGETYYLARIVRDQLGISKSMIQRWKRATLIPDIDHRYFTQKQIDYMQGIIDICTEFRNWPEMRWKQLKVHSRFIKQRWGKSYGSKSYKKAGGPNWKPYIKTKPGDGSIRQKRKRENSE